MKQIRWSRPQQPTCSVELVDVLHVQAVQRDGLVHHGEGTALLQELVQVRALSLLRGGRPLETRRGGSALHQRPGEGVQLRDQERGSALHQRPGEGFSFTLGTRRGGSALH